MSKLFYFIAAAVLLLSSCDRVEKPFPPVVSTELDHSLYPGDWADYEANEWPEFTENMNVNRNVLLEDYTGHRCQNCPAASALATQIEHDNSGRVFVAAIHAGAATNGITAFQELHAPNFLYDFTNPQGLEIASYFFAFDGGFAANPRGTINRKTLGSQIFQAAGSWTGHVSTMLAENDLKVNIQAKINYYPSTRGLFLHTEVEKLETIGDDLAQVVYLIEDSIIKPQLYPANVYPPDGEKLDYVHRSVFRGCIDGRAFGRVLAVEDLNPNGKYYLNYSYQLPEEYAPENMHLLVYVFNKTTHEIYQVVKAEFPE